MRIYICILIGLLILGCGDADRPSKPDDLIAKEKMSDIIYDVFLLNSAKGINKRVLEQNGVLPEEYVYKKYGIDSLQFAKSNHYYSYDTKIYEGIMATVKQKLEDEKKINEALVEKEEKSKDSIKAAELDLKPLPEVLDVMPELDSIVLEKPKKLKPKVFGQGGD
jgi:hypothetical protein